MSMICSKTGLSTGDSYPSDLTDSNAVTRDREIPQSLSLVIMLVVVAILAYGKFYVLKTPLYSKRTKKSN